MTVENRPLLEAIRIIVGEAVAPLTTHVGGLTERVGGLSVQVDGLSERVDGLSVRVDGLSEHVDGLSVRFDGLSERVDGLSVRFDDLTERFDGLSERVDGLSVRVDNQSARMDGLFEHVGGLTVQTDVVIERTERIEAEQRAQREVLESMNLRLATLEGVSRRLETEIEAIETRTAQTSSDIRDLLDQQDKVNKGLRTLRREVEYAIMQIEVLQDNQQAYQHLKQLQDRVDSLERRMARLESPEDTP